MRSLSGERLRSDLTLLATAIFWGSAFVACRVAAEQLGPFLFNGSRFVLGALTLLPFVAPRLGGLSRSELVGGLVAGALLFSGSAVQQAGLQFTTAGKAGFITGLYVVLTPLFLAVIWRKWPGWMSWIAAGLAALGMYFLSALDQLTLSLGDALELVGAAIWALHVIAIDRFAGRADVLRLSLVQCVVCATLSLSVGLGFEARALPKLANVWWAIWYTGVFSVGLGYTLQILGQRHALPADASIILSSEAVFAALAGWLLLNETLTAWQLFGCALMLGGMLLAQARVFASPRQTPGLLPD